MINGTKVIEITESLQNGEIIRLIGNGISPRTKTLEILVPNENVYVKIEGDWNIQRIHTLIGEYLELEKPINKHLDKEYI